MLDTPKLLTHQDPRVQLVQYAEALVFRTFGPEKVLGILEQRLSLFVRVARAKKIVMKRRYDDLAIYEP